MEVEEPKLSVRLATPRACRCEQRVPAADWRLPARRDRLLEMLMRLEGATDESYGSGTRPVTIKPFMTGGYDIGMISQAQIVV